ncbi:hypothetical protein Daesc_004786 [Daldinia eschscholtzii]|uniref:Uncharacterized protein n=1 Tax=Daldinia eschscholtzii TaxID=292717 RepID=A0AAX6MQZ0_9PEZI
MLGRLKAPWLLAPLLAATLSTGQEVKGPHALINLDINSTSDEVNHHGTVLRLDILESKSPCGYGNVTLNGQSLAQDENGAGSGSVISENGVAVLANWSFSCVHLEDEFQGQLMTFDVISLDGKEAHDVTFSIQFQQMAPPSISFVNGTVSITEVDTPNPATEESLTKETSALDNELAELKSMIRQLAALEQAIDSKVQHISETYDFKGPEEFHSVWKCDIDFMSMGMGLKETGILEADRIGPAGDFIMVIVLSGFHMTALIGIIHFYDEETPLVHPPSNHQILEDGMTQENLALATGPDHDIPPTRKLGDDKAEASPHIVDDNSDMPPPMPNHRNRPPPPGFRPHEEMTPHPRPHHNPHFEHHGPPHPIPIVHIAVTIGLLSLLIGAICMRCFAVSRRNRRSTCAERRQSRETRRHCRRNAWANKRAAIGTRYSEIVGWLKETIRRQEAENEEREKDAIMRQLHRSENEEEDTLSTTMEQEIAQFRAVASVVGDLVAAEEGRSREHGNERQHHVTPAPLSPTSAFPEYAPIDEELPAYDEGSNDSRFVADGFRYTPGFLYYTPTESSTMHSSLDENLGRKD